MNQLALVQEIIANVQGSLIATSIRESSWLFPAIEAVHLLALAVLGGALLLVDLSLLGLGIVSTPLARLERDTRPWLIGALLALVGTGLLLAISEAEKLGASQAFLIKMLALASALFLTFGCRHRLALHTSDRPRMRRLVALTSIGLWLTVAAAGRWIGFS
jgi:hypothetical protein